MTDPTPLSPAAQAVVNGALEHDYGQATSVLYRRLAGALRAAADQVVPPEQETPWGSIVQAHAAELRIRQKLLTIAAELEGAQ